MLDGTVPSQYFLCDGTVPSRYFLRDGTVPSQYFLRHLITTYLYNMQAALHRFAVFVALYYCNLEEDIFPTDDSLI